MEDINVECNEDGTLEESNELEESLKFVEDLEEILEKRRIELEEIQVKYRKLGLHWDAGSIRYVLHHGIDGITKTFNMLTVPDLINTLGLIEAAVKDENKADKIFDDWAKSGESISVLHMFIVQDLVDSGFFNSERHVEQLLSMNSHSDLVEEMRVNLLQQEAAIAIRRITDLI